MKKFSASNTLFSTLLGSEILSAVLSLVIGVILGSVLGCTQSTPNTTTRESKNSLRKPTAGLIKYNIKEITELTLGKFDPNTGEHWMTVIKRTDTASKNRSSTANWEITSLPDGNTLEDRRAKATFIMHLLDSLQGLRKIGEAPKGSMESLGLDPPHFVIRVKTDINTHEFRIGGMADDHLSNYVIVNSGRDSGLSSSKEQDLVKEQKNAIIANGSVLKMFPMINTFEFLRDRSWTPFSKDDVDEIILSDRGKQLFYAQREGSKWNDRDHHAIQFASRSKLKKNAPSGVESLLQSLTEIESQGFVDDPTQITQIQNLGSPDSKSPKTHSFEVKLIDRHGTSVSLKLFRLGKPLNPGQSTLFGQSSTRPSTLFILEPKILEILNSI